MGDLLQPMHLLLIGIIFLVLFGARRLPELGKGLGEGLRGFKDGLKGVNEPAAPAANVQASAAPTPAPTTPTEQK